MEGKQTSKSLSIKKSAEAKIVALAIDFGKIYVKIRNGQILRPIKATITLYEDLGHIYKIKKTYAISSSGYRLLNRISSVSLATPQEVIVDGRAQPNPYIERNKETKMIETVHIRKIGIGYSLAGNVVAIDKTLCYSIKTYFLQSIQAKMKRKIWKDGRPTDKLEHPNCAKLGTEDKEPKEEGEWSFFKVEPPLGIWVNHADPAILDCFEEHIQRQRFGDRIAQTIVERNILRDHPAIAQSTVYPKTKDGKTVAHVEIYGYRHELESPDINKVLAQAERGDEVIEVKAETIDEVPIEEEEEAIKDTEKADEEKVKITPKKSPAILDEPPDEIFEELKEKEREPGEEG